MLTPALAQVPLGLEAGGLAPVAPAWVARGASAAAAIALACLLLPRLLRRPPPHPVALRRAVAVRGTAVAGFAGATLTILASALDPAGLPSQGERQVVAIYLAPLGAALGGTLAGAALGGVRGRIRAALAGGAIGFLVWVIPLALGCLLAAAAFGILRARSEPLLVGLTCVVFALGLFGVPALARPGDAFDPHPPG